MIYLSFGAKRGAAFALSAAAACAALSCATKDDGAAPASRSPAVPVGARHAVPVRPKAEPGVSAAAAGPSAPAGPAGEPAGEVDPPFPTEAWRDPVMQKLARATGSSYAALDEGPYRLIVEGGASRASGVAARTVAPVVARLSKQFFEKPPRPGIRLVLFASDATYRRGARAMTGERPGTPYGFYSHEESAVVMNLGTGGGTLVHEMVHTFTETDFPEMPSWFDEGLASLYEQCLFGEGKLVGLTNWRLPDLQERLRGGRRGLVAKVVATSTEDFYGPGSGLHYAVARYVCFDLQEKGLLERFYREFRGGHAKDPTGRGTLERLLGDTLEAYERGWIERTLRLRFPERPGPR